jgi:precorrin-3B synthase
VLLPAPERGAGSPADGGTEWLGVIPPERAVDVVLAILREIAALGPRARASDLLRRCGVDEVRQQFGIVPAPAPERRPAAHMLGRHMLRDASLALGIALPFGHAEADALAELVRRAALCGAQGIRPAPDRVLMLIGLPLARAAGLAAAAGELGLIVDADDPRRRIAACAGAPACALGFVAARHIAAGLATALAPQLARLPDGIAIHVSGCAKGCAHSAPAPLTVVGDAKGCGIIRNGTARATPVRHVALAELVPQITAEVASAFVHAEAIHG